MRPEQCISCDRKVEWQGQGVGWPCDAVVVSTTGNYGSRTFDSFHGETMVFLLCDECVEAKGHMIRIRKAKVQHDYTDLGSYPEWDVDVRERMRVANELMQTEVAVEKPDAN